MKLTTFAASTAALAIALSGAPLMAAGTNTDTNPSPALTSLLDKANQMNHEEIDAADMARDKAGDNLALKSMAETMKEDHKVNQDAVESLASKENVNLSSYKKPAEDDKLSNMKGAQFDRAFLTNQIQDHRKALREFESARNSITDPAVKMYIDETTPVLEAHLKVAENLRRDMESMNSNQQMNNGEKTSER